MDARHCAGAGDGRDDGLCRLGRLGARQAQGGRGGLHRQRHRRHRAFLRPRAGARHHAARPDRLCRLDAARGRDVPRDLPRRADDRAGRLFRPRDHRLARGLPRAFPTSPPQGSCRCASTRTAAASSRGSIRPSSYAVLERYCARRRSAAIAARTELRYLVGTGVSAAAIFHLREELDRAGFDKVKIVASSGFGPAKCRVMAEAKAPIDVVGTGSFLPVELDARPTPPPTSSNMTARSGSRSAASSCTAAARTAAAGRFRFSS